MAAFALPPIAVNWGEAATDQHEIHIVLHLISWVSGHTMQGPDGLNTSRVQIDCYGPTWADARGVAGRVRAALDGYRGGVFRGIFADGMRQTREAGANAGESIYRASADFIIHWRTSHA
ncbi:hypothetical protein [Falsirhodobacter halotolerans]|uniref:hypothetical protein n=1 Tax=Falsirhodobacter halotolerans TaxID=1146892 RepID=UPI001FD39976|nr:hypothetical protein [Falsirhodobacter halotolerans]MCJ8138431.1 hypothetical protein [Falsirhodobacter halotolerans]